jgi:tRNA threonylcarbamoyladenosine biosynthesis protein TsaB
MTILALEFSSEQRSVAVGRGAKVLAETGETGGRGTAAFGMIERVLAKAKMEREEIEVMAVGLGPGSYTGIRSAIALAQGWQLARGTKLLGASSVAAIVAQAMAERIFGRVNVVIDAQRNEFYLAAFEISENDFKEVERLKILPRAEIESRAGAGGIFIGPQAAKMFPNGRTFFPRAAALVEHVAGNTNYVFDEKLEPIYLRETSFVKIQPHKTGVL